MGGALLGKDMPRLRGTATLALGLVFLLLAGCASSPAESDDAADNQVAMQNLAFTPKTITIAVGETVTWVNQDAVSHTVSADDPTQWGTPGSGDGNADWLQKGDSWSHTFTAPGTYNYYCKPHASGSMGSRQGMIGTVIVE